MTISMHQPQYLPWLGYFDKIAKSDCFVFLDRVQYKPREFQNRNKIRIKEGWMWLSVPVMSKSLGRQLISDVRVDNQVEWNRQHAQSLKVWYGRSSYFTNYFPFFEEVYARQWDTLLDLNIRIINYVIQQLDLSRPVYFESELEIKSTATDRIVDICKKLQADTYLSGIGGKKYLEENKLSDAGIRLFYQEFTHPVYRQQFISADHGFVPYLSIIDLLFNEGPESKKFFENRKTERFRY